MHFSSIEFRIAKHSVTGLDMVEVWGEGIFIASIYQAPNGIKIISKHTDKALVVLDIRHDPNAGVDRPYAGSDTKRRSNMNINDPITSKTTLADLWSCFPHPDYLPDLPPGLHEIMHEMFYAGAHALLAILHTRIAESESPKEMANSINALKDELAQNIAETFSGQETNGNIKPRN